MNVINYLIHQIYGRPYNHKFPAFHQALQGDD